MAVPARRGGCSLRGIFSLSLLFFGTLDRWTFRRGLARTGPSTTALNYGRAVYPRAENALSVSSVRARTQIDRRLDVSPEDYLARPSRGREGEGEKREREKDRERYSLTTIAE